ncbi:nicotinate-nucleotide adenylyltransferase [Chloroflexota bacterium]
MRIGVLGGTFDPVHIGHLKMAEEAKTSLELSAIIMVPAGQPLLKSAHPITAAEHRLQMLQLAVANIPHFQVSIMEIERPGPTYTVDTIENLQTHYGNDDEIYFILGCDSLSRFAEWREPVRIIQMCYLVAVPRPGCQPPDIEALEADIPGISRRVMFLDKPKIDISASEIREKVARGLSIRDLVPGQVEEYIWRKKLYTTQ